MEKRHLLAIHCDLNSEFQAATIEITTKCSKNEKESLAVIGFFVVESVQRCK
eukprot:m.73405 g.73405  ORF g.73405 m.73405 type:complete len:52 (+) comp12367_c0_seq4:1964-2119(+)